MGLLGLLLLVVVCSGGFGSGPHGTGTSGATGWLRGRSGRTGILRVRGGTAGRRILRSDERETFVRKVKLETNFKRVILMFLRASASGTKWSQFRKGDLPGEIFAAARSAKLAYLPLRAPGTRPGRSSGIPRCKRGRSRSRSDGSPRGTRAPGPRASTK